MPGDTAPLIISRLPHLHASSENGLTYSGYDRSTMSIDAEREQAVKDALDTVGYCVAFFRQYDEPNEIFASRLIAHIEALITAHNHAFHALARCCACSCTRSGHE